MMQIKEKLKKKVLNAIQMKENDFKITGARPPDRGITFLGLKSERKTISRKKFNFK